MPTESQVNAISAGIFNQARAGTSVNPTGLPVDLANLVVAQARHETGNFTSNAFVRHNNAFGYSYVPGARYQTGPGLIADNGQPVASYATVQDSVKEIVDWIYRRLKEGKFPALSTIRTPEQYARLLKDAGYYGDTFANYSAALKRLFQAASGSVGIGLVAVVAALYYFRRQLF